MKKKITWRLSSYFFFSLIIFTIIISSLFFSFFRQSTFALYETELQQRAIKIADALSQVQKGMTGKGNNAYGAYIRFVNDVAMTDVWIVDDELNIISNHMGQQNKITTTADLPSDASIVVTDVFTGKVSTSRDFSSLFVSSTITIGAPIIVNNQVVGAVLLHSPVSGVDQVLSNALTIMMISILLAFLVAIALSFYLSRNFTKPLLTLNQAAIAMTNKDYVHTDIKLQDEIKTLADNINILAERLKASDEARVRLDKMRQDLMSNISHELRTPITVLKGSLEALRDDVVIDDQSIKTSYEQMLKETDQLHRLVTELLDLSKLQNPDYPLNKSEINLVDVINDAVKSADKLAIAKQISIKTKIDVTNMNIWGDYERLKQMIIIILDNAIKFSYSNSEVLLKLDDQEELVLRIIDNGVGISKEELPFIFDRFHKTNTNNQSGSGLGLSIAKEIASRHDIIIEVSSIKNANTTFSFIIKKGVKDTN
ncbi:MAG: HAMP domain-containing sensor histidine kinase [Erysipelotrichaceae bacterium]|nr:HAMP domain-containing sensor histidine kinase [Erysipelotrichaceae bacterium]